MYISSWLPFPAQSDFDLATEYCYIKSEIGNYLKHFFGLPFLSPADGARRFILCCRFVWDDAGRSPKWKSIATSWLVTILVQTRKTLLPFGLCFHLPHLERQIAANLCTHANQWSLQFTENISRKLLHIWQINKCSIFNLMLSTVKAINPYERNWSRG